ncbi:MAG TPA: 3-oxoacyl-[acyl-carrier-protein] reductase [Candidatus Eisenbacteria bacterium]|jgi:3-oxoacyl-[acyl-carrier protein] reductase|nr:3-oxoacyl-[acyl-carrier-protein] reductase [Candidatus Eisenbacteria bacterium]
MSRPFEGRVAVVTGGAKGIGRAIAVHLAAGGAKLVLAGRSEGPLEELRAEIQAQGGEAVAVRADVAVEADADALCARALEAFGKADILVNNAGVTRDGLLLRMSDADWDQVLDTNLKGAFHCTRAFARPMVRQKWGRMVNITSVIGLIGNAGQANYAASKAGLLGLTKAVAKELASRHITVNAVAPGFIETAMTDALGDKVREGLMAQIPMGRLGKAEDVAQAVGFLCSEGAAYVTGQVLTVDGGMVM